MKTILSGRKDVKSILGKQQIKDCRYRWMKYVITVDRGKETLLHNVITGQQILLSEDESKDLKQFPILGNEITAKLIEDHYLVPEYYDEKKVVDRLRIVLGRLLTPKGVNTYTVLTTTNCNARCFYCYESDLPRFDMTSSTADSLVDYMERHLKKGILHLHWFGGEPLVAANRIDQICCELKKRNIKYVSSMTSNGYLFTEEIIQRAITDWKLDSVQITIDGTENVYNKVKSYVNPEGSPYQRVMANIQKLLEKEIQVIVRLNLDAHNAEDLTKLVTKMESFFTSRCRLTVYSHVLFENAGFKPLKRSEEDRKILYEKQNELNAYLERIKFYRPHSTFPSIKTHCCMADTGNSAVVFPDGRLFKCEHTVIGDEFGTIDSDLFTVENVEKFSQTCELPSCKDCVLYPSCVLLRNCQGLKDRNEYTCSYEIQSALTFLQQIPLEELSNPKDVELRH